MSYPHYMYLRDQLRPDVSVYYNIDDYSLYWPRQARRKCGTSSGSCARAPDLTVCVSRLRAEELRSPRSRKQPGRIHHVPHGARRRSWPRARSQRPAEPPADIAGLPRPYLGYIGSLEDRVDWELMDRISRDVPRRLDRGGRADARHRSTNPGGSLLALPLAPERPRPGLAAAGRYRPILPGV